MSFGIHCVLGILYQSEPLTLFQFPDWDWSDAVLDYGLVHMTQACATGL